VFPARYELNSYIVFRKRLVSKRLKQFLCIVLIDVRCLCLSAACLFIISSGVLVLQVGTDATNKFHIVPLGGSAIME
jgi:hypothetical protein